MDDEKKEFLTDPDDYVLDLSSLQKPEQSADKTKEPPINRQSAEPHGPIGANGKPQFISVYFQCCHAYTRFYLSRDGVAYTGRCPKCLRQGAVGAYEVDASGRMYVAG